VRDDPEHAARTEVIRQRLAESGIRPGPEQPCPYLAGRTARNIVLRYSRPAPGVYHSLMDLNFRRSGTIVYRPACQHCQQCQALRVPADEFRPNRVQRRCWRRNQDLNIQVGFLEPSAEKYELYRRYQQERHDRQLNESWDAFVDFLYRSPMETVEVTLRQAGQLLAVNIVDAEPQAFSMVYTYFAPHARSRSLGVFNILWTIDLARRAGAPYVYLGYYIRDCRKMNYKIHFLPCELLAPDGQWQTHAR